MLIKASGKMKTPVAGFVRIQLVEIGLGLVCCVIVLVGCDRQPTQKPIVNSRPESTISSQPSQTGSSEQIIAPKASSEPRLNLIVQVDGFASDKGVCRVAVYLGKTHFNDLDYAIAKESTAVVDSKAEATLELEIPKAKDTSEIAVCAYHDENDNSRLDKNSFGIPIERYGFSSNPKRGFGPPKFHEAAIDLNAAIVQIESGAKLVIPITIK